ncbi:MAG: DUF1538 domain-containing protein [Gammaproteobacteria bacterium]|nr:DUF1538 domain-containing protein [Gammaproteobacteria bacterium]
MPDESAKRIRVGFRSAVVIVAPYVWERYWEQIKVCMPISLYLALFQFIVLGKTPVAALQIGFSIFVLMCGLMLFMEGLRLGLMPFGENIGSTLPAKSTLTIMLTFAFCVGVGATFAEPAIGTLKQAGTGIDPTKAPLLFALLNDWSTMLVSCIGIGVGIATLLGVLRFVNHWNLASLIIPSVVTLVILSVLASLDENTSAIIGLAWDCGGVTTGPVTVPLVLSLGMGVTSALGEKDTGRSGFGIVTLASLLPIIAVLMLGLVLHYGGLVDYSALASESIQSGGVESAGFLGSPIIGAGVGALRAIVPLCVFLYCVQRFLLKEEIRYFDQILLGIIFTVIGMTLFRVGLDFGLTPLGSQVGSEIPSAFNPPPGLYGDSLGRVVAITFAFILGYGATLAEPALNALGHTVEEITAGAFKKKVLVQAVAIGVAVGISSGIIKIIFDIPLIYILIPPYLVLMVLTLLSSEKFVNIAWDSAGVTTGPITVPLVIAMGLSVGDSVGIIDGFGIISLASVGPILSVLTLGLFIDRATKRLQAQV